MSAMRQSPKVKNDEKAGVGPGFVGVGHVLSMLPVSSASGSVLPYVSLNAALLRKSPAYPAAG